MDLQLLHAVRSEADFDVSLVVDADIFKMKFCIL